MTQENQRDFVKYSFYKIDPSWRRLSSKERDEHKSEFYSVIAEFADRMTISSYSLVGTRGDADLLLWKVSQELEPINELCSQLKRTQLGSYLLTPHSY